MVDSPVEVMFPLKHPSRILPRLPGPMHMIPSIVISWLLVCFWATMSLAADPGPPAAVHAGPDGRPIPAEQLVVAKSDGTKIPFEDFLGDGRAV